MGADRQAGGGYKLHTTDGKCTNKCLEKWVCIYLCK